ncbi:acyltransferase [Paludisphaera sp.]|uniref:acyltransferase family protein n=1 Tax=Paludisphaera sp. TaxID=2017432 RepID=UPI00301BEF93
MPAPDPHQGAASQSRLSVLDGWRAMSILLVLGAHMLPLGPKSLRLNSAAGVAGMSCFFTLSGFLIVTTIFRQPVVSTFLIRRLFRILPAAYLTMGLYLLIQRSPWDFYPPHFAFYVNYDKAHLTPLTAVFWSLCVEIQFYALAAFILATTRLRGFVILPLLGLAITAVKIYTGTPRTIETHFRADEIMVGAGLALIWMDELGPPGRRLRAVISALPYAAWAALFVIGSHPESGPFRYAQPYLAGAMIGATLLAPGRGQAWLGSRPMRYVAETSYALYVIHPLTMHGWLGSGGSVVKYLVKRPLSFILLFGLAHLSTFHYEHRFIALGKRLCRKITDRRQAEPAPVPG